MIHDFDESPEFTSDMTFGQTIRKIRRLLGLNQTDMGEELGYNQKTISSWETGMSSPPIEDAREIYRRYGLRLMIEVKDNEIVRYCRNV